MKIICFLRGNEGKQFFFFKKKSIFASGSESLERGKLRDSDKESGSMEAVEVGISALGWMENLHHLLGTEIFLFPKHERSLSKEYISCFDLNTFFFLVHIPYL